MSNIFKNEKYYKGKWELVGEPQVLDQEDLDMFTPTAVIVKSTYGKSFRFTTKDYYNMYIPADNSVVLPIGSEVELTNIKIAILHKDGCEPIKRVMVIKQTRI